MDSGNLRVAVGLCALTAAVLTTSCGGRDPRDPSLRQSALVSALVRNDERELRGRPELVAGKYARMARSLYDFYRGGVPIFRADLDDARLEVGRTRFDVPGAIPLSLGDAHPENFGLLEARDGSLALEPNDFDAADRYPYWWDLRRLGTGLVLAARLASAEAAAGEEEIVRAAVSAYLDTLGAIRDGSYARRRVSEPGDDPILADLFRRGRRDLAARAELDALVITTEEGARRFLRGAPDADDPENVLQDLPRSAREALPEALRELRTHLVDPPPEEYFAVEDAVRELGTGVASWARIRVLVLIEGPTTDAGDDVILELKEGTQSGASGIVPPGVFASSEPDRIERTTRASWAIPDAEPLWAGTTWLGMPVQARRESEAHKTFRVERLEGDRATVSALTSFARSLGELLARVHGTDALGSVGFAARLLDRVEDRREELIAQEIGASVSYADVVELDWMLFRDALATRGPTLGFVSDVPLAESASTDRRALYGTPAPVQPWE
jgi:uncharacterized protein (DUF2252 family)